MKGFPNQVAELPKLAAAMKCLTEVEDSGENGKDDEVFGEALVRAGVAGTGHKPKPVEAYLKAQSHKSPSNRSYRTTARGLRELFRLMLLIDDSGSKLITTELGRHAASFSGQPRNDEQINFWRGVIRNIEHDDTHGRTHPYQILLHLVAKKPRITRAKCALALEAKNDTQEEMNRLVGLADLPEDEIIQKIGVTKSNWDNAKKVLPKFAEQLHDVIRTGDSYVIADAPGRTDAGPAETAKPSVSRSGAGERRIELKKPRAPRTSREVIPETIGKAGLADRSDEVTNLSLTSDPAALAAAIKTRGDRLRRHNLLVREFATLFNRAGAILYEDPFDILALFTDLAVLVEVKTLDGTDSDQRERVRDAFGQLFYYESFLSGAVVGEAPIDKIACFESKISDDHRTWLNGHRVATVWKDNCDLVCDELAREFLSAHMEQFR